MTPPPSSRRGVVGFPAVFLGCTLALAGCASTPAQAPVGPAVPATKPATVSPSPRQLNLAPFDTGLPQAGQWRDQLAVADVNRDGRPDIVLAPARKTLRPPAIFLGDGKGGWARWQDAHFPSLPYDYGGVAVGDFDADGQADLALGFHLRGIAALRGDGSGNFADATAGLPLKRSAEPLPFSARQVYLQDWQGTGKTDLVALGEGMASLYSGLMAFGYRQDGWQPLPRDAIADRARLAAPVRGKACLVVAGQSAESGWQFHERCAGVWRPLPVADLPQTASPVAIAAAELDGDGIADLAISYRLRVGGRWHLAIDLIQSGAGTPQRRTLVSAGELKQATLALAFGRPRGGDRLDLAAVGQDGRLSVYALDGTALARVDAPTWRGGCQGHGIEMADLDGDGGDEIIAIFAGEPSAFSLAEEQCRQGGAVSVWRAVRP